ncbi:hypothetical protein REPUB_Repub20aG0147600 [Reevesia pubescens]
MADQISIRVCDQLRQKLGCLSSTLLDNFIFKVPHQLRRINEKAYEPQFISIGPDHRGKDHLKAMETHKLHYLKMHLQRRNESVGRYVDAMRALEDRARNCYVDAVDDVSPEAFVEMMILDGCFIVELIARYVEKELRDENDDLFKLNSITVKIMHDLLLLENQLPFFVLLKLIGMSYKNEMPDTAERYFVDMALVFFTPIAPPPGLGKQHEQPRSIQDIRHLLFFFFSFSSCLKYLQIKLTATRLVEGKGIKAQIICYIYI